MAHLPQPRLYRATCVSMHALHSTGCTPAGVAPRGFFLSVALARLPLPLPSCGGTAASAKELLPSCSPISGGTAAPPLEVG